MGNGEKQCLETAFLKIHQRHSEDYGVSEGGRLHLHDGRCGGVCSVSRLWDIPRGNGVEESGDLSAC